MKIAFDEISSNARLWIYQAARELTPEEINVVENTLDQFTQAWDSHGAPLQAAFTIIRNQFIAIAVDEGINAASGCSIDKSVAIMKELQATLNISLLEKSTIAYLKNDTVYTVDFRNVKEKIEVEEIDIDTEVFDLTLTTVQDFRQGWPKEASKTWLNRFFGVKTLS